MKKKSWQVQRWGFRIDGKRLLGLRRDPVFGGQLEPEEKGSRDGRGILKDSSDLCLIVSSFLDVMCCNFSSRKQIFSTSLLLCNSLG